MARPEMDHLELLAEVDALLGRLQDWAESAPAWQPGDPCRALVRRLAQRADSLRLRIEAPLVVATLGGTGTGKSALVNALLGAEVVETGRQRPTTVRPTLICRPDISPQMLGIPPDSVQLVHRDLPSLANLVLIDCPDPDTTEDTDSAGTNLARLRDLLPHCDVLLVTTTQQKYRSARVADELATAAGGARLVFVQTHADVDQDVRDDWRQSLDPRYATGHVFLIDSVSALAGDCPDFRGDCPDFRASENGTVPFNAPTTGDSENRTVPFAATQAEMADLVDLLTRQLAGAAAARIRRANFLDLVDDVIQRCRLRIDQQMPAIERLRTAIDQQRAVLAAELARRTRAELLANRRQWEGRILGQVTARWGLSPFALVLRLFHSLGGLLMGTLLWRARTPAQLALWGAVGGLRSWQEHRRQQQTDQSADRAVAGCWNPTGLRRAAVILEGYTTEAGLPREAASLPTITDEADRAGAAFVDDVAGQLDALVAQLAERHTGRFTRWRYELLLMAMLGVLLYYLGKNFFYDSLLHGAPALGLDAYLVAAFWLALWCLLLIVSFTRRLRAGLARQLDQLAEDWSTPTSAATLFAQLDTHCRQVNQFREDLDGLGNQVTHLRRHLAEPGDSLGHLRQ